MSTLPTNTSLLDAKNQFPSDNRPAPLAGPSNLVSFALQNIAPPAEAYIQRDDQLIVQVASQSQGSDVVTFNARLFTVDGTIVPIQRQIQTAVNQGQTTVTIPLAEGFMLSASAFTSFSTQHGGCFVRAFINRGIFGQGSPGLTLFADYVTTFQGTSYPNGRVVSPEEGPGIVTTLGVNSPAAGSDFVITIPVNSRVRVQSITATLVTSAAAATRDAELIIDTNPTVILRIPASATQLAGITDVYNGSTGFNSSPNPASDVQWVLPENLQLAAGMRVRALTANLQGGDQWSLVNMIVEQWLSGV